MPIPVDRYETIQGVHNETIGHHGVERTLHLLDIKGVKWRGRRTQVEKFVRECPICQKFDTRTRTNGAHAYTTSSYRATDRINIDSIGPLAPSDGYCHIMVVIDCFTRFVELYPLRTAGGEEAAQALFDYVNRYGNPSVIRTDGGSQFDNGVVRELVRKLGSTFEINTAHSKEENSMVERANREVVRHLRNFMAPTRTLDGWHTKIRQVQRIINGSVHHTLGIAPATALYAGQVDLHKGVLTSLPQGEEDDVPMSEWIEDLLKFQSELHATLKKSLEEHDKGSIAERIGEVTQFDIGSYVLVSHPAGRFQQVGEQKLRPSRMGPMRVESFDKDHYTLRDLVNPNRTTRAHVSRLTEFRYDPTQVAPAEVALIDTESFIVERVLSHRYQGKPNVKLTRQCRKKDLEFKVKWEGYDEPTWEPWHNLLANRALHDYLRTKNFASLIPPQYA
jgi:hypothetical protein